jgi:hypothetical protein
VVVAIAGQMGAATADGFVLEQPNIQVFERKVCNDGEPPKQKEAEATPASSSQQSIETSKVRADAEAETKLTEKSEPLVKQPAPQAQPKLKRLASLTLRFGES